ncbi:hypothetical protein GCM10011581_12000 [Saccharopolyspora subtropica]|uniref:ESX secretion-associated protein EspG n=1 Tax=Saccharopolyspora thermophila TaxID=89367 RepID=A0A917NA01_9PSEU|nr:hypothetical protein GCM10011581_12000 [Saccharopolyspora subtropica]
MDEFGGLLRDQAVAPEIGAFLLGGTDAGRAPRDSRWDELADGLRRASVFGFVEVTGGPERRAVVAVGNRHAARMVVADGTVTAKEIRPDAPWPALVGVLPDMAAAEGCEVTVPTRVLAEARAEATRRTEQRVDWLAYELKLRQVPPDDARAISDLMRRADGMAARFTVGLRAASGALRIGPLAVEVHHAPTGRVAVIPESPDDTYCMVAPADAYLLGRTLQGFVEDLWTTTSEQTQPLPR